jgi:hypothetical protein
MPHCPQCKGLSAVVTQEPEQFNLPPEHVEPHVP